MKVINIQLNFLFQLMEKLLSSKPFMSPLNTTSSTGKRSYSPSQCSTSSVDNCLDNEDNSQPSKLIIYYN